MISSYMGVVKQAAIRLALITAVVGLAACGGGDKKNKPTPTLVPTQAPDTTPADFSFTLPQATFGVGEEATSDSITITGLDTLTDISISAGGEYAIDGGSFTSAAGQIANNQTLVVRAMAGANFDDAVVVTVNIGTESQTFTVVTEPADTTPTDFSFTLPQLNYERGELATTTSITITGLNTLADISVSAGGEYSVDGGSFTSAAGQIANDQTLEVRVTAGANFDETLNVTVNIGTASQTFSVVTEAQDTTPEVFSFTDAVDVAMGELSQSAPVTINSITGDVAVSVTGGEYSLDGGDYTSAAGTVINGQSVVVRAVAPITASDSLDVVLTVGTVNDTYSIATLVDSTAPVVELHFPTQVGLTDATTLRVRGVASDDLSEITSLTVNGVSAETTDGFANWQVTIDLALGETEIEVVATDAVGLSSTAAVFSTITRRDDLSGAYNVADESMERFFGLQFLPDTEQLFVAEDKRNYYLLDADTGAATMVSTAVDPINHDQNVNGRTYASAYYSINGEQGIYAGGTIGIYHVNLESGVRTLLTDASYGDDSLPFDHLRALAVYEGATLGDSYLFAGNILSNQLMRVDLQSGEKQVFSDNANTGLGEAIVGSLGVENIGISTEKGLVYVSTSIAIYEVDLGFETRTLLATNDEPNDIHIPRFGSILLANGSDICGIALDAGTRFLSCVDLSEGGSFDKRVVSNSITPGETEGVTSGAGWAARGLYYMSYANTIGVTDLVTGEPLVLMKVAN